MIEATHTPECMICGTEYEFARWKIGKKTCLPCGDAAAEAACEAACEAA